MNEGQHPGIVGQPAEAASLQLPKPVESLDVVVAADKKMSTFGGALLLLTGPLTGLLPERLALKLTRGNEQAAYNLTIVSRTFNAAYSVYALASWIAGAFGYEIDPSPGRALTKVGIGVAVDTLMREGYLKLVGDPGDTMGEPILAAIDSARHPEFYKNRGNIFD